MTLPLYSIALLVIGASLLINAADRYVFGEDMTVTEAWERAKVGHWFRGAERRNHMRLHFEHHAVDGGWKGTVTDRDGRDPQKPLYTTPVRKWPSLVTRDFETWERKRAQDQADRARVPAA